MEDVSSSGSESDRDQGGFDSSDIGAGGFSSSDNEYTVIAEHVLPRGLGDDPAPHSRSRSPHRSEPVFQSPDTAPKEGIAWDLRPALEESLRNWQVPILHAMFHVRKAMFFSHVLLRKMTIESVFTGNYTENYPLQVIKQRNCFSHFQSTMLAADSVGIACFLTHC